MLSLYYYILLYSWEGGADHQCSNWGHVADVHIVANNVLHFILSFLKIKYLGFDYRGKLSWISYNIFLYYSATGFSVQELLQYLVLCMLSYNSFSSYVYHTVHSTMELDLLLYHQSLREPSASFLSLPLSSLCWIT